VKPTGLWQRAEYFKNNCSPFGRIIINNEEPDHLFENADTYQPQYFPTGMPFDIYCSKVMEKPPADKVSEHTKKNPFDEHKSLVKTWMGTCLKLPTIRFGRLDENDNLKL
jgi:hypothetical protein